MQGKGEADPGMWGLSNPQHVREAGIYTRYNYKQVSLDMCNWQC